MQVPDLRLNTRRDAQDMSFSIIELARFVGRGSGGREVMAPVIAAEGRKEGVELVFAAS